MNFFDVLQKTNEQKLEPPKSKRGRKSHFRKEESAVENPISPDYRPAGRKDSPLDFQQTLTAYTKLGKRKDLSSDEKIIAHNYDLLKSCYRTPTWLLSLAKTFIGRFNFDPFYNIHGFTGSPDFATDEFKTLSGYSSEDDGFLLSNWNDITRDVETPTALINPPFNKLEDAARIVNAFVEDNEKCPQIAFITTLDWTNYLSDCFRTANYFVMLGRVQFLGMPGVNISSPRGSVGMCVYNSILDIGPSRFISYKGNTYYCVNLEEKRSTKRLDQMEIGEKV